MAVLTVAFYGTFILNSGRRPGDVQVIVLCCHKEIVLWWYVKNWTGEHKVFIVMFNVRFYSVWIIPGSESVCKGSCTKMSLQLIPVWFTVSLISTCATVYWVFMCLNPRVTAFVCYTSLPLALMTTCFACESARLDKPSLWLFVMHVLFTDGGSSAQYCNYYVMLKFDNHKVSKHLILNIPVL